MFRIAAMGVAGAILALWLKSVKAEYAIFVTLVSGLFLGFAILTKLQPVVEQMQQLLGFLEGYGGSVRLLIKIIGITYLAEVSANLCRDAGAGTLASQIELFGKLSILVFCMPIIASLLETIEHFLGGA